MKYLLYLVLIMITSCESEKREDTIQREIKLKETRKGYEVVKLNIVREKTMADTSEVYFNADIKIKTKDSTIIDSIFLIKGTDGVLLPFSTKNP